MKLFARIILILGTSGVVLAGCATEVTSSRAFDEAADETGEASPAEPIPDAEKFDTASASGPRVRAGVSTEVWSVKNAWSDRDTDAAKTAGIAWGENSGLTWEEKYQAWVQSLRAIPTDSYYDTIEITNPQGVTLQAPALECAEVAMFLRAAFASWYKLPFYVSGYMGGQTVYAGHFGFINGSGTRVSNFPNFRTAYKDYESSYKAGDAWPHDTKLRTYHLGSDDENPFLGAGLGAGAYFDEMFLNKRVGYFMRLLLLYFGSINLVQSTNMYHLDPEAIRAGDVQFERWARKGIGHTIPVMRVEAAEEGRVAVSVATGSMPRRQPHWEGSASSQSYFTVEYAGGPGVNEDGEEYAKLGGGLHRWRTPVYRSGRWYGEITAESAPFFIDSSDTAAIAARIATFESLLDSLTPEEQLQAAVSKIEAMRMHLRNYPASCSARENREKAFDSLYEVLELNSGYSRTQIDEDYRTLEDYVFGRLEYTRSKTCCWNSTTPEMSAIILEYAQNEQAAAAAAGMCVEPTVFRSRSDGYALWRNYAASTGRAAQWREWSEDEPCAQRSVAEDTLDNADVTPLCR